MVKVGIATINFNLRQDTLELLESARKLDTKDLEIKIFVVSNEPLETSAEVILKKENRGSAGGYNDGVKAALAWGADYILLVNNDVLFKSPALLRSLKETLEKDPQSGAVSPKILFAPGFEFYKDRYSKKDQGKVLWYAGGSFDWANINSAHRGIDEVDTGKYDEVGPTDFVSGSAVLVKKEVFARNIFWDENLFAYLDDNDFQEKIRRAGFKLFYDGKVSVFHKVSRTSGIGSSTSDYYVGRNRLIFGLRYASLRTKFALLREAFRILLSGRPMQKRGVIDFFLGTRGELGHQ